MQEKKISIWKAILLMILPFLLYSILYICYRFIFDGKPITSSKFTEDSLIVSQYILHFCSILTIFYGFKKFGFSFHIGKRSLTKNNFAAVFLLSFCFFMVAPLLFNLNLFFTNDLPKSVKNTPTPIIIHYFIISMVILSPILEELLFKNIFSKLKKNYSILFSMFLVSLFFTLIHLQGLYWYSFFDYFLFSIVGCIIFLKTESIILCIFFHFLNNLFIQISKPYNTFLYEEIYTQYGYVFVIIFAIFGLFRLLKMLKK